MKKAYWIDGPLLTERDLQHIRTQLGPARLGVADLYQLLARLHPIYSGRLMWLVPSAKDGTARPGGRVVGVSRRCLASLNRAIYVGPTTRATSRRTLP